VCARARARVSSMKATGTWKILAMRLAASSIACAFATSFETFSIASSIVICPSIGSHSDESEPNSITRPVSIG